MQGSYPPKQMLKREASSKPLRDRAPSRHERTIKYDRNKLAEHYIQAARPARCAHEERVSPSSSASTPKLAATIRSPKVRSSLPRGDEPNTVRRLP